ncbi:MAG: AsnC family transcriptional regulator [Phycisphaerales bacterium]|nr:MAG: AsnC family transcriptional regulator [Phycisphaerales bacterium]
MKTPNCRNDHYVIADFVILLKKDLMDELDRRILRELQHDFPLIEKPYEVIADRLKISGQELWSRVQRMLDAGMIRRMGASFDSKRLGFYSTLAAVSVEPALVERAAEVIGAFPEVTHNYLRNDTFNIWFTMIAVDQARIEHVLEEIRESLSLERSAVLNLPVQRLFKLDARFGVSRQT